MRFNYFEAKWSRPQNGQDQRYCDRVLVGCSESEGTCSWGITILVVHSGIAMTYAHDEQGVDDASHNYFNRDEKAWMVRLLRGMADLSSRFAEYTGEDRVELLAHLMSMFSESDFYSYKWEEQEPYQWKQEVAEE